MLPAPATSLKNVKRISAGREGNPRTDARTHHGYDAAVLYHPIRCQAPHVVSFTHPTAPRRGGEVGSAPEREVCKLQRSANPKVEVNPQYAIGHKSECKSH